MRDFLQRFFYGRYGVDQLSVFLTAVSVVLSLSASLSHIRLLSWGADVLLFWVLFRILSRKLERRRQENTRFLSLVYPAYQALRRKRSQARDRDHCYFKCPGCGQQLRVPRGKGSITITCRSCGAVFQKKT